MAGEIIRPSALPPREAPVASEIVPSDNGSVVGGVTWAAGVAAGRPLANQAEAEVGENATKAMTPLTTKQAIDANAVVTVVAGANTTVDATDPNNPVISYDGSAVTDGDKGAMTVTESGAVWNYNDDTLARVKLITHFERVLPLNLWEFGAFGNDNEGSLVDETTEILAAITAASAQKRELYIPGTNYLSDRITWTAPFSLYLQGDPVNRPVIRPLQAIADASGSDGRLWQFTNGNYTGNEEGAYTLAGNIGPFDTRIALTDVDGIEPGMMIQIVSDQLWYYDDRGEYYRGEIHLVSKVLPGTDEVEIDDYVRDTYQPGTQTVTVRVWRPDELVMDNLAFVFPDAADITARSRALVTDRLFRPQFNNVLIEGAISSGILNSRSWMARYNDMELRNVGLDLGGGASTGYGIQDAGTYGTVMRGLKSRGMRRTVDFDSLTSQVVAAPVRDALVTDFHITGGNSDVLGEEWYPGGDGENYGIGGHGPIENIVFRDGYISDVQTGINARNRNTTIQNVHFAGRMIDCIVATYGTGLIVQNCRYMRDDWPNKKSSVNLLQSEMPESFVKLSATDVSAAFTYESPVVIEGNVAHGLRYGFIDFAASSTQSVKNLTVRNNTALIRTAAGETFEFFNSPATVRLFQSCIGPNFIRDDGDGTLIMYPSNLQIGYVANGGLDAAVQVGAREWLVRLADDEACRIRNAAVLAGDRVMLWMTGSGGQVNSIFTIAAMSTTTDPIGTLDTDIAANATGVLTGTTGTDGKLNVSLTAGGDIYIENRTGAGRRYAIKVL